jgi:hypothetical protein
MAVRLHGCIRTLPPELSAAAFGRKKKLEHVH